jgi:hypothetical protein
MKTKERFRLAPASTASNWLTLWSSLHEAAKRARGAPGDVGPPRLSNREAVAVVAAFRGLARQTVEGWPLWYQFAALGYGWDATTDRFLVTRAQADGLYSIGATAELWDATKRIAANLEEEKPLAAGVRVELDPHAFSDLDVIGDTRQALIDDGAKATATVGASSPAPEKKLKRSPKREDHTTFVMVAIALGGLYLATRRKPRRRRRTTTNRSRSHARA